MMTVVLSFVSLSLVVQRSRLSRKKVEVETGEVEGARRQGAEDRGQVRPVTRRPSSVICLALAFRTIAVRVISTFRIVGDVRGESRNAS
jgi:hypothetical protein